MKNASKKILFIALMVVVTLSLSGIAISARTTSGEIRQKALNTALEQAGVNADDIYDVEIEIERKKGVEIVEVEFESKGKDYEYHINKETGEIVDSKIKNDNYVKPDDTTIDTVVPEGKKITKEAALQIALTESGYAATDVRDLEIDLDKEKDVYYYEVDFEVVINVIILDYEYDIDAYTGEIVNKKVKEEKSASAAVTPKDPSDPTAPVAPSEPEKPAASADQKPADTKPADTKITKEEALAIVISDAGINKEDAKDLDIELDREKGILIYEIDFEIYSNMQEIEYEYDINAVTGEIIKKEVEIDD